MTATVRTRVAIVGAGPAGLLLSHLLAGVGHRIGRRSIAHARADRDARSAPASSSRAPSRCSTRSASSAARAPSARATTASSCASPATATASTSQSARRAQRLAVPAARGAEGPHRRAPRGRPGPALRRHGRAGRRRRGVTAPRDRRPTPTGRPLVIEADFVVGADGSRSVVRAAVTGSSTGGYFREYPFAWFGILTRSAAERTRADLQQLPGRLRAHQPAQRRPCSACTSSATPKPTRTR